MYKCLDISTKGVSSSYYLIIKHKKMETIIYKTIPSNSFNSNDCGDSIFRYFKGDHTLCFVHHLGEHNKSEYNYFVPTGSDSGIYFVKEIDAVNFGTNSYQYGVSKAWFSMGEYSEAHNYVFSDSPSL